MSSQLVSPPSTPALEKTSKPNPPRKLNLRYGLAILGGLLLIISTFLPWISVHYDNINQNISMNGWGTITSSSPLAELSKLPLVESGWLVVALGGLALIVGLGMFFLNRAEGAAILLVFGLFVMAIMFYQLMSTGEVLSEVKKIAATFFINESTGAKISPPMNATIGYGLLLGLLATLLVILGGVLPLAGKQPQRRRR